MGYVALPYTTTVVESGNLNRKLDLQRLPTVSVQKDFLPPFAAALVAKLHGTMGDFFQGGKPTSPVGIFTGRQ